MATPSKNIRVIVAEADPISRAAVASELGTVEGVSIVAWVGCAESFLPQLDVLRPDLAVIALDIPGGDGISLYGAMREAYPSIATLVFDTRFRVDGGRELLDESTRAEVSAFVVATQLVPKVQRLFTSLAVAG